MNAPVAVLVGAPGSGKSTVGPLLAEALGTSFRDTDHDIEAAAKKSISEIFIDDGEDVFRAMEHEAVMSALTDHCGVLSLGGGAILDHRTRTALCEHRVVWLQVALKDATRRVGLGTSRPVLNFNPRATLGALLKARAPLYEEVADLIVDTSGHSAQQIVADLIIALQGAADE